LQRGVIILQSLLCHGQEEIRLIIQVIPVRPAIATGGIWVEIRSGFGVEGFDTVVWSAELMDFIGRWSWIAVGTSYAGVCTCLL
jgi:hypothetical protein